jgi:hypothetical protein
MRAIAPLEPELLGNELLGKKTKRVIQACWLDVGCSKSKLSFFWGETMSQNNNFAGGFLLGALLGGVVGGVVGAAIAKRSEERDEGTPRLPSTQPLKLDSEENIELARRRLEDKIAQLNLAIDDVRQQLSTGKELPLHSESSRD